MNSFSCKYNIHVCAKEPCMKFEDSLHEEYLATLQNYSHAISDSNKKKLVRGSLVTKH